MDRSLLTVELIAFALKRITEYDFTHYAFPALERRLNQLVEQLKLDDKESLLLDILDQDEELLDIVIQSLTITYSKFFRDSAYFYRLFTTVFPQLDAFPALKVWTIACSKGEEVYSIASLLKLAKLLDRTTIIGSDINRKALQIAKQGEYDSARLDEVQANFRDINLKGQYSLLDCVEYDEQIFRFKEDIRKHCSFTAHNLVTGSSLGSMHLVTCRNVLIYLKEDEQKRVLSEVIVPSLVPGGFLMLGEAENLLDFAKDLDLTRISRTINIYQYSA